MCFPDTHRKDADERLAEVTQLTAPQALAGVRELMEGYQPYPVLADTEDPDELERRGADFEDYLQDAAGRVDAIYRLLAAAAGTGTPTTMAA
ncbi:hypothetical protein [Pseudactinotalea terrae]|uniref:hypothetical protein n=1 Tax=Pseudactinotalea terrae TaxID=1743262 RepID=UPI0012E10356|nr:hypothetical protein [Pseudactinotalea terrae]